MDKHDLHHEFPEFEQKIHQLKVSDNHFKKLFDEYHEVNKQVHHFETAEETSDTHLEELKKQRLFLKDQIAVILRG